jgi:hypothetical protein
VQHLGNKNQNHDDDDDDNNNREPVQLYQCPESLLLEYTFPSIMSTPSQAHCVECAERHRLSICKCLNSVGNIPVRLHCIFSLCLSIFYLTKFYRNHSTLLLKMFVLKTSLVPLKIKQKASFVQQEEIKRNHDNNSLLILNDNCWECQMRISDFSTSRFHPMQMEPSSQIMVEEAVLAREKAAVAAHIAIQEFEKKENEKRCFEIEKEVRETHEVIMEVQLENMKKQQIREKTIRAATATNEGEEEDNNNNNNMDMNILSDSLKKAIKYVSTLKKNHLIEVGYKDGMKYSVKVKDIHIPNYNNTLLNEILTLLGYETKSSPSKKTLLQNNYSVVIQYDNDKSIEKIPYHFFLLRVVSPITGTWIEQPQEWAQCSECGKWRRLAQGIDASTLPDIWTCQQNIGSKYISCNMAEEKPTEEEVGYSTSSSSTDGSSSVWSPIRSLNSDDISTPLDNTFKNKSESEDDEDQSIMLNNPSSVIDALIHSSDQDEEQPSDNGLDHWDLT